jgi:hypothetical protein
VKPAANPFAAVRAACAHVAGAAKHVAIDAAALAPYAAALPLEQVRSAGAGNPYARIADDAESRCAFVLALDTINFGSGYFPLLTKLPGHSGYRTIEAHLVRRFETQGALLAAELGETSAADCAALFGQTGSDPGVRELMGLFARAWRDLGELVDERHGGSFASLVRSADGSAAALVQELLRMPLYRDVADYAGAPVPFYKRAQIAAADLALALPGPLGRFSDLDDLTIFADNLVPHVLKLDGVLRFASALDARIEREELIAWGSPEEVEIRACAVHAVELLCAEVRARGSALSAHQLDQWLWRRGGEPSYKARPRHRTRCSFY